MNIINSIQKLESDIKRLDTKFRYSNINNNISNVRSNDYGEVSKDEDDEESEIIQGEESKVLQDEESKLNRVPSYQISKGVKKCSNRSKIYVSNDYESQINARNVALIHAGQFKNECIDTRVQYKAKYQEQDSI